MPVARLTDEAAGATAVTFVLVPGAVEVAVMEGVPSRLPGVALGSPVLLGAERASRCWRSRWVR